MLAGFPLHELAAVRALMDQAGGQDVRVVPTTPAMLHAPTAEALRQPEPLVRPLGRRGGQCAAAWRCSLVRC